MIRRSPHLLLILFALLLSAAVAPRPAPAAPEYIVAPLDSAPFGLNTHLATRYPDPNSMNIPANLIARSGASWVREDIHWYRIQPTAETWDWTFTDQAIRELAKRKINIVGVLGHPPGWATAYTGDAPSGFSFYAPDAQRFAVFTQAVVSRYSRYIHHWEVWNEPDNTLFWKPTPDPANYARLLRTVSQSIRHTDPHAKILIGGTNPFDTEFLGQVAEDGAWDSFDIIAIHPYVDPATPEAGNILAAADGVRALAARYGTKPIWATEVGWASGPGDRDTIGPTDPQTQANNLVRALLLLWRSGVERIFWYELKDDPGNPYGLVAFGTGRADYRTLKPAFYAFRTLNQQLAGATFIGLHDPFKRSVVLDFESFGSWRRGDQPYGQLTPTDAVQHSGRAAARLDYTFPTAGNDYVVFRRDWPAAIPGRPYALGVWVYGDGSGNTLKVWLRDAEDEIVQYTLGTIGPPGWRLLQAPLGGPIASWDRINQIGNGRLDFPARLDAIVLDDAPDTFSGNGTLYLDDLSTISGPEAYDLELRRGDTTLDILWAPLPLHARISNTGTSATIVERDGTENDGAQRELTIDPSILGLNIGPAPIYVQHDR